MIDQEAGENRRTCMSGELSAPQKPQTDQWKALTQVSTAELVQRIAAESDRSALAIFLETRRSFCLRNHGNLLLPEFLLKLRERLAPPGGYTAKQARLADCAYDLTLAKYSNLPSSNRHKSRCEGRSLKGTNIHCGNYYKAAMERICKARDKGKVGSQLQDEARTGKILQNMVYKNFLRSVQECRRDTPFSVRYTWQVKGKRLYLWYPSHMSVKAFKAWLRDKVSEVDPERPKEQERIQSLIESQLQRGCHVSLCDSDMAALPTIDGGPSVVEIGEGVMFVNKLARQVAEELAGNMDCLRPSIRQLGKPTLERLVLKIFSHLVRGDFVGSRIARQYGVSKATFNRFAGGIRFKDSEDSDIEYLPDLWRSTAKILAENPDFMDTVVTSGIAGDLKKVLEFIEKSGARK